MKNLKILLPVLLGLSSLSAVAIENSQQQVSSSYGCFSDASGYAVYKVTTLNGIPVKSEPFEISISSVKECEDRAMSYNTPRPQQQGQIDGSPSEHKNNYYPVYLPKSNRTNY